MTTTYDRDVSHCSKSKYVTRTTIESVRPADNSDNLDCVTFEGLGYQAVTMRGQFSKGDVVVFIPGETLIPNELADLLGIRGFLSKSRVRTVKLRGNRSEGVVARPQDVAPFLDDLLKWETPERFVQSGGGKRTIGKRFKEWLKPDLPPEDFCRFHDMGRLENSPKLFLEGEEVWVSEKIHGANFRVATLPIRWKWWSKPFMSWVRPLGRVYVGSHNVIKNHGGNDLWNAAYQKFLSNGNGPRFPPGYIFFGEAFGYYGSTPIQHLAYGRADLDLLLFAAFEVERQAYLLPSVFVSLCDTYGLPHVTFHPVTYDGVEAMRARAEEPSETTIQHHREGIVICSNERPGVFAKVISFKYLCTEDRTEAKG